MNPKLSKELKKKYNLADEQIAGLESLGVADAGDMAFINAEDLTDLGVKPVAARKIIAAYAPAQQPTAPAAPSLPSTIVVKTGRPEDMSLRELVQAVADGERSLDYVNALRHLTGSKRVFVRVADGDKLDVEATLELIEHVGDDFDAPDFWGDQPTETLNEILEKRALAHPLTGAKLAKGDPWMKVSEERRVLAAYARLAQLLSGKEDEYTLAEELQAQNLTGRWTRIQKAFAMAEKAHNPIVDQARASIYYRSSQGGRGMTAAPFRRPEGGHNGEW